MQLTKYLLLILHSSMFKKLMTMMMMMNIPHKPLIAMLFTHIVYAGMALFSKSAIASGMNPYVFVAYRQAFASLALAPLAFFRERKNISPMSFNLLCKIFLTSLCGLTLSLNLYYFALHYTSAAFAAATTNTIPAITFIMAVLLRMESVGLKQWHGMAKVLGSIMGVSGALVFAFVKGPPINLSFIHWKIMDNKEEASNHYSIRELIKGSLIMLLANSAWSLWLILQGPIIKQYPAKLRLTSLQCFFSCIQSIFWAIAMERDPSSWKLGWDVNLLSIVYCGIVVTGITYWLQMWVIEKKGPVFTAAFTPLSLIITAICSALLWKEDFHLGSVLGAMLLFGGLYCILWGKNKEEKTKDDQGQGNKGIEKTALPNIITISVHH